MLEGIFYGIAAALVFLGLVCAAYIITAAVFRADFCGRLVVVLSPNEKNCDISSLLYAAHIRLALWGDCCKGRIIIVDNGLNQKQLDLCKRIMDECGSMELCKAHELAGVIDRKES